jgi:FkbM family methyltransferase
MKNRTATYVTKAREMWRFLKTQYAFRRAPLLTLCRSAGWYGRCFARKPTVLELPRWKIRMLFPSQRRGFGKFIFAFREYYEPELAYLEKILTSGMIFVDAGANFGVYTLVASRLVGPAGKVLAFEPTVQSFAVLRQNIELNRFPNVDAFQVALAEERGEAWLNYGWDPVGNWVGEGPHGKNQGEEVQAESLDQILEGKGIRHVDAIKIDVEGGEERVLRGSVRCLTESKPIVIFEFNPACAHRCGLSPWGAADFLECLGYEFMLLGDCATSAASDSRPTYFNIVAIPDRSAQQFPCSSRFIDHLRMRI